MTRPRGRARPMLVLAAVAMAAGACAPARPALPTGRWDPVPAAWGDVFAEASAPCAGVRTLTAEIAVSGSVGGRKLRGRVLAGFERPGSIRLEAVAPFGPPFFILAASGDDATLLLPRDRRVLAHARAGEVLGALTGLSLSPDDLGALLAGCVSADLTPLDAGAQRDGWARVSLRGGTEAYLRRTSGVWRILRGLRAPAAPGAGPSLTVDYANAVSGFPRTVRVWQDPVAGRGSSAALVFQLSQVETNVAIDAAAFRVVVPADAAPISLDELRRTGPLAGATPRDPR